jgi:predicted Fe-Mo cluster-binding NifX family protein
MKNIAVSATGPTLEASVDPRFGHCRYYLLVDPADLSFEAVENPHGRVRRGAGVQIAKFLSDRGADVVLTGQCGPGAIAESAWSGIDVKTGCDGTVREAIERFLARGDARAMPASGTTGATGRGRRQRRRRRRRATEPFEDAREGRA